MQTVTATSASRFSTPASAFMRGPAAMPAPLARMQPAREVSLPPGVTRSLVKGEEIFAEGDACDFFYKVVSGAIRTYKLLNDGRRQIDAFHLAGDIFGLEAGDEHRFSADAVNDATVFAYRRCTLESLSLRDAALSLQVVTSMMRNLARAQDHMLLLGRKTAQEKIASFLLDMARRISCGETFELPMQRSDIADHLGLTIETVSRTLTQFARDGVIELAAASRAVILRDKAALQRLNA